MVDVVELVRDDVETHRIIASRKNIELSMVCNETIPRTRVDPTGIHQVVSNLLSNAIKYSHRDSTVTVAIARVEGELQITVQDRGQGIPADELNSLFEPYRVTSVRPTAGETSTGLGLSIVRDVVEAHGGHVHVESTVASGSTFFVRMPLDSSSAQCSDLS
jgi:signal transduction histidine kinase